MRKGGKKERKKDKIISTYSLTDKNKQILKSEQVKYFLLAYLDVTNK